MDPHSRWCHNRNRRAYGRPGEGHIVIHSQKERRYRCKHCRRTFSETKDTALYRMHKPRWLVLAAGVMIAQVIKRCQRRRVVEVIRRVVVGREAEMISRVIGTQRSIRALINTAYIERLNATFRERLAPLVRRTRAGAHKQEMLEGGMWLVGSCYNFVWSHRSLTGECTPTMAAGLTEHRWSMEELLGFGAPPRELPRWRGRKPKWLLEAERAG